MALDGAYDYGIDGFMMKKQRETAKAKSVKQDSAAAHDKQAARRDRQAQLLRENLARRKAQRLGRQSG